jgi:cysteine-rich secretory family protein
VPRTEQPPGTPAPLSPFGRRRPHRILTAVLRHALVPLLLLAGLTAWVPATAARAEEVEELDDDGKLLFRYVTDEDGRKHGGFVAFHPNGKTKIRAQYRHGRMHGQYVTFDERGKRAIQATYKEGKLQGNYIEQDGKGRPVVLATYVNGALDGKREIYKDGEVVSTQTWKLGEPLDIDGVRPFGKQKDAIRDTIADIFDSSDPLENDASDEFADGRGEALRYLKIYRYLSDLEYADLVLDKNLNAHADAASKLCEAIGRLDHTPENPGWPEDEYKFAYIGTSRSNLCMGKSIEDQVHAYMDDSDDSNIDRVGHRRWCLNPGMVKTGFGVQGKFSAMMAHDRSRKKIPDYDFVAYPSPGYYPMHYFGNHYAWSVSLHRRKWDEPKGSLKVTLQPLDDDFVARRPPLEIDYLKISLQGMGIRNCIIFRPKGFEVAPSRWRVTIDGLTRKDKPTPLTYLVEFFEL